MVQLSPREQEVFDVLYVENKTYELAAGRLGITVGTINYHVHNIRTKLRAADEPVPDNRKHFVTH